MKIGVDVRPFLSRETGVGMYLKNLLFHLARIDASNEYYLFSSSWKERFAPEKRPPFIRGRFRDFRCPVKAVNFLWYRWGWPRLDAFFGTRLDLTHSPTPLLLPSSGKKIITVYDLFFLDEPGKADREAGRIFYRKAGTSIKRADGILVISEFTKRSLQEKFDIQEEKIKVTPLGVNPIFKKGGSSAGAEDTLRKHGLPRDFLLFVGALEPRKNLLNLLEALKIVRRKAPDVVLVIAGREGRDSRKIMETITRDNLSSCVYRTGYLPEEEIRDLYRTARLFIFPSLCEGFGLPPLEAMASGTAVAASAAGALPEIAGDAAVYFEPEDPSDMARAIFELWADDRKRAEFIAKGERRAERFTWERTAALTLDFYRSVAGRS